jgi:hypothetical protein
MHDTVYGVRIAIVAGSYRAFRECVHLRACSVLYIPLCAFKSICDCVWTDVYYPLFVLDEGTMHWIAEVPMALL